MIKIKGKWTWKAEYIKYLIGTAVFMVWVLPYLIVVWYVVPVADDFSFGADIVTAGGHGLTGVFNLVKTNYFKWQGTFLATALEGGIDPLNRVGFVGINIVLFIVVLGLIVTFKILLSKLCISRFDKNIADILVVLAILGMFVTRLVQESLLWYVGACAYTIPFIVGCFGIVCELKISEQDNKKIRYVVAASILGMLAGGGTLQNAGYFCWIYLLFLGCDFFDKKPIKYHLIPFLSAFCGALINVAAPGNYVRKAGRYESVSLFVAAKYTLIAVWQELSYLLSQTYVPIILLVIAILAVIYIHPVEKGIWNPIVVSAAMAAGWIISTFPICYGYASSVLTERSVTTLDWFIVAGLFMIVLSIANWCRRKAVTISRGTIYVTALLVIMHIGYIQNLVPIAQTPGLMCWREILSGEAAQYHDEWIAVFNAIEVSDKAVVEVRISNEAARRDKVVKHPDMSENYDNWVNQAVARYYGKENVRVLTEEMVE